MLPAGIIEIREMRDRVAVFRSRAHAGEVLADMLAAFKGTDALLLGIPAGGIPVAAAMADRLGLPLDLAIVSKITLPWNTEVGYGAVAFEGTVRLNEELLPYLNLTRKQIDAGIDATRQKVQNRQQLFRGDRPLPDLGRATAILVDDGLASGLTMQVAVEAVGNIGASRVIVAVPTGHEQAVIRVAAQANGVYCANIRGGRGFAVADAYDRWTDVAEEEVLALLRPKVGKP